MRVTRAGICSRRPRVSARIGEVAVPATATSTTSSPLRAFRPDPGDGEPGLAARRFDPASGAFADLPRDLIR